MQAIKKWTIAIIAITVGALHFVTGENYHGPFPVFVNDYLIDILLPMTLFLLMGLFENRIIRSVLFRACAVFGFGCFVEASQYFGHPVFGSTFDPLDILAYAGGVALGILLVVAPNCGVRILSRFRQTQLYSLDDNQEARGKYNESTGKN